MNNNNINNNSAAWLSDTENLIATKALIKNTK